MSSTWDRYQDLQLRLLMRINERAIAYKFAARHFEREVAFGREVTMIDNTTAINDALARMNKEEASLNAAQDAYHQSNYAAFCLAEEAKVAA